MRIRRSPGPDRPGSAVVTAPASRPVANAASVLAMANGGPSTPMVTTTMLGPITGDDTQKAITGASGRPRRSSAAISGSTPRPQTGVSVPARLASTTARTGPPDTQAQARSDQCPRARAPASRAARITTGNSVSSPRATSTTSAGPGRGNSEPSTISPPVTTQVRVSPPGRERRGSTESMRTLSVDVDT